MLPARLVELALRNRSLSKLDGVACCGDADVPYDVVPAKFRDGGVYVVDVGGWDAAGRAGVTGAWVRCAARCCCCCAGRDPSDCRLGRDAPCAPCGDVSGAPRLAAPYERSDAAAVDAADVGEAAPDASGCDARGGTPGLYSGGPVRVLLPLLLVLPLPPPARRVLPSRAGLPCPPLLLLLCPPRCDPPALWPCRDSPSWRVR